MDTLYVPQMIMKRNRYGRVVLRLGGVYGEWVLGPPDEDNNTTWVSLKEPEPAVPDDVWEMVWTAYDIYTRGGGEGMQKPVEVGADWTRINETRQHLVEVWTDLTKRQYETTEEALMAGQVAQAFKDAEESLFETINIAQSQGDPDAQTAIQALGPGLMATSIAAREAEVGQEAH